MSKSKLLTETHVCYLLGVHRATLGRWRDEGIFPEPGFTKRRPNGRITSMRWHIDVVMDWLEAAKG